MTTSIQLNQVLTGVRLVTVLPLTLDGDVPEINNLMKFYGVTDIQIQTQVEQGERTIDKADGIGVIGMHEEDDTLLGIDLNFSANHFNIHLFEQIMAGPSTTENEKVIGWYAPTIQEQKDNPKRFQVDIYVRTLNDTFLKHRFFYCKGFLQGFNHTLGKITEPSISIKAREHPTIKRINEMTLVQEIPTI